MSYENKPKTAFKPYPDGGNLNSSATKNNAGSPDYWGTIAINLKDTTAISVVDGLTIVKLSGWKKKDASGKTYLSLAVNRYVPEEAKQAPKAAKPNSGFDDMDDDVPF
jgi:hypothetical protein